MIWEDIGSRTYMEDRVSVDTTLYKDYEYYAVFDGHGGADVSTYLAVHLKKVVKGVLINHAIKHAHAHAHAHQHQFVDVSEVLHESFKQVVNDIPYKLSFDRGSTAVVVIRNKTNIWVANCGDTRAIMNSLKDTVPLTDDHKPTRKDEYMRITSLGGNVAQAFKGDVFRVNGMLAVSRAIGDFALAPHVTWKPEISHFTIDTRKNHYIMIATDGVWDVTSNEDAVALINNAVLEDQWKDIGGKLITRSRQLGSTDNIAICLILL